MSTPLKTRWTNNNYINLYSNQFFNDKQYKELEKQILAQGPSDRSFSKGPTGSKVYYLIAMIIDLMRQFSPVHNHSMLSTVHEDYELDLENFLNLPELSFLNDGKT